MRPLFFTDDATFEFEAERVFGHATYGGSDFVEAMMTAQSITSGDYDSWRRAWADRAERVRGEATKALAAGHRVSARDGFLRAASYYRSAEFFTRHEVDDPQGLELYEKSAECFVAFGELSDPPVERIEVPYEDTSLNAYLCHAVTASGDDRERPTLLMFNGFDGWAEELYHGGGRGAVERGYTVILFDGPGQPGPRYRDGLTFRPDWENVVGPVIDAVVGRPEVDPDRIALMGNSMGGGLAPRAAAYEQRLAATIAIDGVYDAGLAFITILGVGVSDSAELDALSDEEINTRVAAKVAVDSQARWAARQGMWAFGAGTPAEFCRTIAPYHLRDGVAERISRPLYIGVAAHDQFFQGQPEELASRVARPTLASFTDDDAAGTHCQVGAQRLLSARMIDWLTDTLE